MAETWSAAIADELEKLNGTPDDPSYRASVIVKKRATIIALIDARLAGRSEESVWLRPDTCNRKIYHTKWKKDPLFAEVLERATAIAHRWKDEEGLRAMERAQKLLQLATPHAAATVVDQLKSADERVAQSAAFGILKGTGVTANNSNVSVHNTEGEEMSLEEWRQQAALRTHQVNATMADFEEYEEEEDDDGE